MFAGKEEVGYLLSIWTMYLIFFSALPTNSLCPLCFHIDLICCDGCTKVYHAYCHKPKLDKLPDGDWYCMVCCQTKKAAAKPPKEKKKKYSGQLIADLGHCDMQCTVRFPKMECIVCEEVEG